MAKTKTVQEFVDKYNNQNSDVAKEKYLKSMIKTEYIGYMSKITLANKIVDSSFYENPMEENKKILINSPVRFLLYIYTMIHMYTDIPISNDTMAEDYDILDKNNLIDKIFEYIPKSEQDEFNKILDMVYNDKIANNYETKAFINNQLNKLASALDTITDMITPEVIDAFVSESNTSLRDKIFKALSIMSKNRK